MKSFAALLAVLALICAGPVLAQTDPIPQTTASPLVEGDLHFDRRGEGAREDVCAPAEIDAAIAAYHRALAASDDLEVRYKLMRALQYRGVFCGGDVPERKKFLDEGKDLAQGTVERLERGLNGAKGSARIEALKKIPEAAPIYFWAAACWGQWAVVHGAAAAATKGVAGKVRDLAQTALELDPSYEQAGPHRVLGRLHDKTPAIPLITGWASSKKALKHLREAYALAPDDRVGQLFLGEAILKNEPEKREEAIRILKECAAATPRPGYLVEDRHYSELAKATLAAAR
jgi:tetratricopeptide (TPR) repeat protein